LRGRYFSNKRSAANCIRAIGNFQTAIEIDATYAPAYSGLSDAFWGQMFTGTPAEKVREKTTWAAVKAVELDPALPEAHDSLAAVRESFDWNWAEAEKEYRKAIELNPNSAAAHQAYANFLASKRPAEEALAEAQKAQDLDPMSPFVRTIYCLDLAFARRYEQAIANSKEAVALDPDFYHAHGNLSGIYASLGM